MGTTKVMQTASCLHDIIDIVIRPVTKLMRDNIAAFDATNLMFYFNPFAGNLTIVLFIGFAQRLIAWLFLGLPDRHSRRCKSLKSTVLPKRTPLGELVLFPITNRFSVG